jgi:hypothetical protein
MGNDTRFAITLTAALLVWSPVGIGLLGGRVSFFDAAWKFAASLALSAIGVAILNKLIVRYGTENAVRDIQEAEARRGDSDEGDVGLNLDS